MGFFKNSTSIRKKLKIAITGGPCAGKTALVNVLAMHFHKDLMPVEEAASFLFRSGFPRHSDFERKKCQERAIYFLQRELENLTELNPAAAGLLCDRGGLDSLAYWPDSSANFFKSVKSSLQEELERYDWVIHIDSAPPFELTCTSLRTENAEESEALNEKVKQAWSAHPQRIILPSDLDFEGKTEVAVKVVSRILHTHRQIAELATCEGTPEQSLNELR